MAAKAISDVESLYNWIQNAGGEQGNKPKPDPTWITVGPALRAMIDDQAALKTAIDAIDALSGGGGDDLDDAQVLSTAAKAASEAAIA